MVITSSFFAADEFSPAVTPTSLEHITNVELTGSEFDNLYMTQNPDVTDFSAGWNFDTVMSADFEDNKATAGNIDFLVSNVSYILIKRKKATDFSWTTILVNEVNDKDDLNVSGVDITPGNGTYQYAAVMVLNSDEGNYNIATVDVSISYLMLADVTGVWKTDLTDGNCDVTCVVPNQVVEPMYSKYPTVISNGETNYQTIAVSGEFIPTTTDDGTCDPSAADDDETRIKYQKELLDFLTNRKTKILKNIDGRRWLVHITTPPTDAADEYYKSRKLSFECTEIGDPDSSEDLYVAGIIDVSEEWW